MIKQLTALCLLTVAFSAQAKDSLLRATDFSNTDSHQNKHVYVVLVSRYDCSYCDLVREDFLLPLERQSNQAYPAQIRELKVDSDKLLVDFDGAQISPKKFAARYNASFTPTLLFLNQDGAQVHQKLVGISNKEFYGYYLDQAIEQSYRALNTQ